MSNINFNITFPVGDTATAEAARDFFDRLSQRNAQSVSDSAVEQFTDPALGQRWDHPDADPIADLEHAAHNTNASAETDTAPADAGKSWTVPDHLNGSEGNQSADAEEWPQEVDGLLVSIDGVPWNADIHSGNKKCYGGKDKNKGRWMKKRGVEWDEYERHTEHMKGAVSGQPLQQQQQQQQAPQGDPQPQYNAGAAFGGQQQQAPQGEPTVKTSADFFQRVMSGGFSPNAQTAVCEQYGWGAISMAATLASRNPLIFDEVLAALEQQKAMGV